MCALPLPRLVSVITTSYGLLCSVVMPGHTYTHVPTHIHTNEHTHTQTYIQTHTYTHVHTHIHTHVHTHIHTHARTHTQMLSDSAVHDTGQSKSA